jgi:hypothetical protein
LAALTAVSNFGPPARNTGWRYDATMSQDRAPYDLSQPFNADELLDGFTEERRQVPVDPDTVLGRAMAEARKAWAAPDYEPLDPDDFHVEPVPVRLDDE